MCMELISLIMELNVRVTHTSGTGKVFLPAPDVRITSILLHDYGVGSKNLHSDTTKHM